MAADFYGLSSGSAQDLHLVHFCAQSQFSLSDCPVTVGGFSGSCFQMANVVFLDS